jgi:hypothetical protein
MLWRRTTATTGSFRVKRRNARGGVPAYIPYRLSVRWPVWMPIRFIAWITANASNAPATTVTSGHEIHCGLTLSLRGRPDFHPAYTVSAARITIAAMVMIESMRSDMARALLRRKMPPLGKTVAIDAGAPGQTRREGEAG